jgi:hypothetical protein
MNDDPHSRSIVEDANSLAIEISQELRPEDWLMHKWKVELILRQYLQELVREARNDSSNNRHVSVVS